MPVLGFLAILGGGLLIWSGYLGETVGTVTRAVLDGKTGDLVKKPLDPTKKESTPATSTDTGGQA